MRLVKGCTCYFQMITSATATFSYLPLIGNNTIGFLVQKFDTNTSCKNISRFKFCLCDSILYNFFYKQLQMNNIHENNFVSKLMEQNVFTLLALFIHHITVNIFAHHLSVYLLHMSLSLFLCLFYNCILLEDTQAFQEHSHQT